MLDHLDDVSPYVPDERLRAAVGKRARALRWRRRTAVVAAMTALAAPIAAGLWWRSVQPQRVDVIVPVDETSTSVAASASQAAVTTDGPAAVAAIDILVVGTDSPRDDPSITGSRGDTILVLRIDVASGTRRILSIPRDLYVTNPTTGEHDRINALVGDRAALVKVVQDLTGVHIDHYVELDLATFAILGDALGGIDVGFDAALRDLHSGFEAPAGCVHLNGQALRAYARSRYLEAFDGQRWQPDGTSDFGRMARLGDVAQRVVSSMLDPGTIDLGALIDDVLPKLTVDRDLTISAAKDIVRTARSLAGRPVEWTMVPATPALVTLNGANADVLVADAPADVHRWLVDGTTTSPPPSAASTDSRAAAGIMPSTTLSCGH